MLPVQTNELPEDAPRQGGSSGGRGPPSCVPAALPSPLPKDTKEPLLPPQPWTAGRATALGSRRAAQMALPEEQVGEAGGERPRPGTEEKPAQATPAPTLAGAYLHRNQEYAPLTGPGGPLVIFGAPQPRAPAGSLKLPSSPRATTDGRSRSRPRLHHDREPPPSPDCLPQQPGGREAERPAQNGCSGAELSSAGVTHRLSV